MKNIKTGLIITLIGIIFWLSGCNKIISINTDKPVIDAEISNAKTAMDLSHLYNDTLITNYETLTIHKNNLSLIKYDKLYHNWDSIFNAQHHLFGNELYKYGKQMIGFTPVIVTGKLTYSDGMTTDELIQDTIVMHVYYADMQQLQLIHQHYHNSIYNQSGN